MKSSSCSNSEPDDDIHLMTHSPKNNVQIDNDSCELSISSIESSDSWKVDSIQLEQETVVTLENCSNIYFDDYIDMRSTSKFPWLNCEQLLIKSDFSIPNKFNCLFALIALI